MSHVCVISNNLVSGGGVLTKLKGFLRYAASREMQCDLFFPVVKEYREEDVDMLRNTGAIHRFYPVPVPEIAPHFVRGAVFGKRCNISNTYDAYQLVCGSMVPGLPFAKKCLPFVAWGANPASVEQKTLPRNKIRHYYLYNPLSDYMVLRQETFCGSMAACVIAQTRCHADNLRLVLGIPEEKIELMPNPVDTEMFSPGEPVQIPRRYILTVNRLDREKDVSTLLRAFKQVRDRNPEVELRIAGDGKERQELEREARSLGLGKSVVFLGLLRGEELSRQYRGAALCVFSSPQESFGNVYVEAMASGKPVVSTNSGAILDHVEHGRTGFIVPPYDSDGLGECVRKILDDPELAARMGRLNRERAVAHYGFDKFYRRMDSIYKRVFGIPPERRESAYEPDQRQA